MAHHTGRIEAYRSAGDANGLARAAAYLGLGAAAMYIADPDRGRRRRALARDRLTHASRVLNEGARATSRDLTKRVYGLWAVGKNRFRRSHASDEVLIPRIRSQLGRVVSHPHAIEVAVRDAQVVLSGPILAREVDALMACVRKVPGVGAVENRMAVYREAGNVSALQGGYPRVRNRFELLQENLSPASRLLAGLAGGAFMLGGLRQRSGFGTLVAAAGLALLARAAMNREIAAVVGFADGTRGIDVQKTIHVNAPVEDVFAFWTNYENFPRFMTNVLAIEALGGNRSHWIVCGPAGATIEWTSEMTAVVPTELIEWRTVEGSMAKHCGTVRFDRNDIGGTRVSIKLCYVPLAGAIGHAVARLFGTDPKSKMDADLMRMKSMIETGRPPHEAAGRSAAARSSASTEASPA